MSSQELKQRRSVGEAVPDTVGGSDVKESEDEHPAGEVKHGGHIQILRLLLFTTNFVSCCVTWVLSA